jgi:hypothetical protein
MPALLTTNGHVVDGLRGRGHGGLVGDVEDDGHDALVAAWLRRARGRVDLCRAASEELVDECAPEAAMAAGDKGDSAVDQRAL